MVAAVLLSVFFSFCVFFAKFGFSALWEGLLPPAPRGESQKMARKPCRGSCEPSSLKLLPGKRFSPTGPGQFLLFVSLFRAGLWALGQHLPPAARALTRDPAPHPGAALGGRTEAQGGGEGSTCGAPLRLPPGGWVWFPFRRQTTSLVTFFGPSTKDRTCV